MHLLPAREAKCSSCSSLSNHKHSGCVSTDAALGDIYYSFSSKWEWMVWERAVRALQYQHRSLLLGTRWFLLMFCLWCGGRDNSRSPGAASWIPGGRTPGDVELSLVLWPWCPQAEYDSLQGQSISLQESSTLLFAKVWRGPGTQGTLNSSKAERCLLVHGSFQSLSWELGSSASAVASYSVTSYSHFLEHWFCFPFVHWL